MANIIVPIILSIILLLGAKYVNKENLKNVAMIIGIILLSVGLIVGLFIGIEKLNEFDMLRGEITDIDKLEKPSS